MVSLKDYHAKVKRRVRRKGSIRRRVFGLTDKPRLTVSRSHQNISCQLIDDTTGATLASSSSLQKDLRGKIEGFRGNCAAAAIIGAAIAEKAKALGIVNVQFDRNGFRFHGRVKALADAAREGGLKF